MSTHRGLPTAARALAGALALGVVGALPATAAARTPREVLRSALAPLLGGSYRASFTSAVTTSFADVSPPQLAAALPGLPPVRSGGRLDVETPRRTLTTQSAFGSRVAVVAYDSQVFVSTDGRTYRRAVGPLRSQLSTLGRQGSAAGVRTFLDHLAGLRAMGATRRDGLLVRRYRGTLDEAFLRGLLTRTVLSARLPADIVAAVATTARLDSGTVDFFVTPAGRLTGIERAERTSMDMVPLLRGRGTAVPDGVSGTLVLDSAFSTRVSGGGAVVRVRRPKASGTVSALAQLP
ncbi:MAG: hypothetical protein QOK40_2453 [Miltoncostaeaceae bacterium]|nr:hypothetical protein [Miltoncostaeaceae bacterium]